MFPNPQTVPSSNNTIVEFTWLADTSATFSIKLFLVNVTLFPVVPSPKLPYALYPETHKLLSLSIAKLDWFPALIFVIFSSESTFVGKYLAVVSPTPSAPYPLYPHPYTFPSLSTASEYESPAVTAIIFSNTPDPSGDLTWTFV